MKCGAYGRLELESDSEYTREPATYHPGSTFPANSSYYAPLFHQTKRQALVSGMRGFLTNFVGNKPEETGSTCALRLGGGGGTKMEVDSGLTFRRPDSLLAWVFVGHRHGKRKSVQSYGVCLVLPGSPEGVAA